MAPTRYRDYWQHIQATYGLSREQYERLAVAQGGRCAGCRCQPKKQRLGVDHSHALDKVYGKGDVRSVRGLLCSMCNHKILGTARDNPETLGRLKNYLEDPPAPRVLGLVAVQVQPEDVPPPEPDNGDVETHL
jgi:hypothetical protein